MWRSSTSNACSTALKLWPLFSSWSSSREVSCWAREYHAHPSCVARARCWRGRRWSRSDIWKSEIEFNSGNIQNVWNGKMKDDDPNFEIGGATKSTKVCNNIRDEPFSQHILIALTWMVFRRCDTAHETWGPSGSSSSCHNRNTWTWGRRASACDSWPEKRKGTQGHRIIN